MTEFGFSGTQRGMTELQSNAVASLLDIYRKEFGFTTIHLGDCIGADEEMWELATGKGFHTVGHPPIKTIKRAFKKYDEMWPPYDYLERNKHIVTCSKRMIFAPGENTEQLRSGTWATKREAERQGLQFEIVYPDGRIVTHLTHIARLF